MRLLSKLVIALCGLLVAGCSSTFEISSSPIAPQRPISDPAHVRIVLARPGASYTEVARIELRWNGMLSESQIRHDERIRRMLQTEAARLGADAVIDLMPIVVEQGQRPDEWWLQPPRIVGVSATAVRTKSRA